MKLIREANEDDKFNRQMLKIQDAIEALEKINLEWPVASQVRMLEVAGDDLRKLADGLKAKLKK